MTFDRIDKNQQLDCLQMGSQVFVNRYSIAIEWISINCVALMNGYKNTKCTKSADMTEKYYFDPICDISVRKLIFDIIFDIDNKNKVQTFPFNDIDQAYCL